MRDCCRAGPCEEMFDSRVAQADLDEYLEDGLGSLESRMVDELRNLGAVARARVLEIGGGIGAIQAELLQEGAASGEVIELVAAYRAYAGRLAAKRGFADRTSWRVHDILADPDAVEPADVVVMNRVVCCSADGPALAAAAAGLTTRALVLSYPRSTRLTRFAAAAQRAAYRLFGRQYRAFAWPEERLIRAAASGGLVEASRGGGLIWRYLVMLRPA